MSTVQISTSALVTQAPYGPWQFSSSEVLLQDEMNHILRVQLSSQSEIHNTPAQSPVSLARPGDDQHQHLLAKDSRAGGCGLGLRCLPPPPFFGGVSCALGI